MKINHTKKQVKEKLIKLVRDEKNYILLLIVMVFFGALNKLEFATDTYCVFATPIKQYCEHFLYSGRFISAMCLAITEFFGLTSNMIYISSYIIAIVATIIAMQRLYKIFEKEINNKFIVIIGVTLIIINAFSIELFLFLEKGILMLSVLFCVLAFEQYTKYIKTNKRRYIIWTFLYMVLSNFSYQGTVGIFVGLAIVYIAKYSDNLVSFVKNNFVAAICYGIPALINYLVVKVLFNNQRVSGKTDIAQSLQLIMKNTKEMLISTYNILPKYFFIVMAIIVLIFYLIIVMTKKDKSNKLILLGKLIYIILGVYIVTIFPQIMQSTNSIGFAPRNTYAFASIIGLIIIYIFMIKDAKSRIIENLMIVFAIVMLLAQYIGFSNIIRNRYILNYNDYYNAIQITDKINKYEQTTGKHITKVSIYKQNGNSLSYPDLWLSGDINIKATCPDWNRTDYLEYYLNRELKEVENDLQIYDEYFSKKDWKIFDIEQVVLIEDTMHICLY